MHAIFQLSRPNENNSICFCFFFSFQTSTSMLINNQQEREKKEKSTLINKDSKQERAREKQNKVMGFLP
jgi:hypothetical protein